MAVALMMKFGARLGLPSSLQPERAHDNIPIPPFAFSRHPALGFREKGQESTMGCWGVGTFENDDASDWIWTLEESDGLAVVERALAAPSSGACVETPEAREALAAAEVVAALLGHPASDLPVDVARWVAEHRGLDARALRDAALRRVRAVLGNDSELRARWEENEDEFPFWKATLEALIARLSSAV
jgi:hypothetical protein